MSDTSSEKPFIRLMEMLDALPTKLGDGVPLRDVIPGLWPTVGDLRRLTATKVREQEGK